MAKKNKRVLIIVASAVLLLTVITVAYAYFIASVQTVNEQTVVAETGTMRLIMTDGNAGWSEVWDFGESKSKTLTLQNTGSLPVTVDLYWKNLVNTFLEGSMVYSLKQTTDDATPVETYLAGSASTFENIPTSATSVSTNKIASNITVPANKTYTYTMTIKLVNSPTVDQTADSSAQFYTEFDIREYVPPVVSPLAVDTLKISLNGSTDEEKSSYVNYQYNNNQSSILCRVLYNDNDYGLQIIAVNPVRSVSLGKNDNTVSGSGITKVVNSYNRAILTLNEYAQTYMDTINGSGIAIDARSVGSMPDNKNSELSNIGAASFTDTTYGDHYWLASRNNSSGSGSIYFGIYTVNTLGTQSTKGNYTLFDAYQGDGIELSNNGTGTFGLRPVFTINPNAKVIDGNGTIASPYVLSL